jgi:hypothetical protein
MRLFALSTARLAFRYARRHRHDGLGAVAVRCIRCAPMEYEQSPQGNLPPGYGDAPAPFPPPSDNIIRLADFQARNMDARYDPPPPPPKPLPWEN